MPSNYRGRFAPSPTGPLHFGSLLAAISSYAQARQHNGQWLVRIEDIDLPRCDPAFSTDILKTLECYGMNWDEEIIYQSQRDELYQTVLDDLSAKNHSYGCACSRKQINENITDADKQPVYPGTCRNGLKEGSIARSIRLRTNNKTITFNDLIQGNYSQNIASQVGDFIIKRADNIFAYQLAVVVDDEMQNITEIVRGSDMLDSTPRQIFLQQLLAYSTPAYMHIPIAVTAEGQKLSKQNRALPVATDDPRATLIEALTFLQQQPPQDLQDCDIDSIWAWIIQHWSVKAIPAQYAIPYNDAND